MKARETKLVLVLFLSFILISVPPIQSVTSSEPKTTKTGNVTQLWKFPVVSNLCNLPVVIDGLVYVTACYAAGSLGYVYCLNASTGAIVWNYTTAYYIFSPLHVAEGITYKDTGSILYPDVFYVLNATTGEEMWNLKETGGVPFIAGGYLCLGNSCFNATTGAKIWEFPTELRRIQPFVVGDHAFINGYISKNDFSELIVYCLDLSTGTHLWNYTYTKMLLTVVDNHVFLWTTDPSNPDADVNNIIALDVFTGNKIWNYTVGGSFNTEIIEDSVYIGSGDTVYRVDATTGAEKWNYQLEDYHVSDLVVVNSSVYVSYGERLQCLDASTGDTKWMRTDVDVTHGLCCFGDEVYFGTAGERHRRGEYRDSDISTLYCLDAHTGTQIFNYTINGNTRHMIMVDDILYVGASYPFEYPVPKTGYVYSLKLTMEEVPISSSPPSEEVPVPHSPSSLDTQQILIAFIGVSAILLVTFFVYRKRQRS